MNTYKITFTRENGTTGCDKFTAATEAQARRDFKEVYRHGNGEITSVELVSENTPATKEQERKALEKIKKIVAELGEGSYVGTALDGCLQDAESNIENDFGDSMKSRFEFAQRQLEAAQEKIAELKKNYADGYAEWSETVTADKETIKSLQERVLEPDDLTDLIQLVSEKRFALDEEVKNAAERIVEAAGEPDSAAFKNAVNDHRVAKRDLDYYTALIERVVKARQ